VPAAIGSRQLADALVSAGPASGRGPISAAPAAPGQPA
jgi:hypothetical protein